MSHHQEWYCVTVLSVINVYVYVVVVVDIVVVVDVAVVDVTVVDVVVDIAVAVVDVVVVGVIVVILVILRLFIFYEKTNRKIKWKWNKLIINFLEKWQRITSQMTEWVDY